MNFLSYRSFSKSKQPPSDSIFSSNPAPSARKRSSKEIDLLCLSKLDVTLWIEHYDPKYKIFYYTNDTPSEITTIEDSINLALETGRRQFRIKGQKYSRIIKWDEPPSGAANIRFLSEPRVATCTAGNLQAVEVG